MGWNASTYPDRRGPAEMVPWSAAMQFCEKLNARERANGRQIGGFEFRLPTEAEWEYACRAGATVMPDQATLDSMCWSYLNSGKTPHPVGTRRPNGWGFYDMLGNVSEWCLDWYGDGYYAQAPAVDPLNRQAETRRSVRGSHCADGCTFSIRHAITPDSKSWYIGFRVCLGPEIEMK